MAECLAIVGFSDLAGSVPATAENIRRLRWQVRADTGFAPENFTIPKRFYQVKTWKGPINGSYLDKLKEEYGRRIMALVKKVDPPA